MLADPGRGASGASSGDASAATQQIRKLAAEAEAWVRCDSRGWPFAFASICDVLGLNVDAARARFLASPEHPASGWAGGATRGQRAIGAAGACLVPQRGGHEDHRRPDARAPSWRTGSGRETGAGVGVRVA